MISLKRADMDCYYLFVKTPTLEELVTYLEFALMFSTNPETIFRMMMSLTIREDLLSLLLLLM